MRVCVGSRWVLLRLNCNGRLIGTNSRKVACSGIDSSACNTVRSLSLARSHCTYSAVHCISRVAYRIFQGQKGPA